MCNIMYNTFLNMFLLQKPQWFCYALGTLQWPFLSLRLKGKVLPLICKSLCDLASSGWYLILFELRLFFSPSFTQYYRHMNLLSVLEFFRPVTKIFILAKTFKNIFPTDICILAPNFVHVFKCYIFTILFLVHQHYLCTFCSPLCCSSWNTEN